MGAIGYRRFSLLAAGLLAAALAWAITNPIRVDAGNWKRYERTWEHHVTTDDEHEHHYNYSYEHYDKYDDSDCECRDDYEEEVSNDACEDPTNPDDGGTQGGDDSSEDDPTDPADPADPVLELNIDQQVQVGGGAFVDAEDDATAPEGQVGDPVVWQVTVAVDQAPENEDRTVKIVWEKPANVDVTTSQASAGSFDGSTWTVGISDMPAVLTINSTLNGSGLSSSTARITEISCSDAGGIGVAGYCEFKDGIESNNTNPAGVAAGAATVADPSPTTLPTSGTGVLGASTTGSGSNNTNSSNNGVVLASAQGGEVSRGRVLAAATLADTGSNISAVAYLLVGGLLSLAPLAVVRVRK